VQTPDAVAGWLATTMRRNCIRILRLRQREQLDGDWLRWNLADDKPDPADRLVREERGRLLWNSVDRLPQRQRDLMRALFDGRELPYDEVARSMAMPAGAIGPTRQRALRRLRKMLVHADVRTC
jgi:RNA polymerase sigma factor (sigma-70 family)